MKSDQSGFTLIELIVVIVILGILAATALPKFVDLQSDAGTAGAAGVAGGITSAFSINYAARKVNAAKGLVYQSATPCAVASINTVMQAPLPTTGYTIAAVGAPDCTGLDGTTFSCTVTPTQGTAATATGICVP